MSREVAVYAVEQRIWRQGPALRRALAATPARTHCSERFGSKNRLRQLPGGDFQWDFSSRNIDVGFSSLQNIPSIHTHHCNAGGHATNICDYDV